MTQDEARQARVDRLIAEMETTIAEAQETSVRMANFFRQVGIEDDSALVDMVDSNRCSPDLRRMIDDDMARLDGELKEAEQALLADAGDRRPPRPRRNMRRMTRV